MYHRSKVIESVMTEAPPMDQKNSLLWKSVGSAMFFQLEGQLSHLSSHYENFLMSIKTSE